jgi:hypothetical protein
VHALGGRQWFRNIACGHIEQSGQIASINKDTARSSKTADRQSMEQNDEGRTKAILAVGYVDPSNSSSRASFMVSFRPNVHFIGFIFHIIFLISEPIRGKESGTGSN